MADWTYRTALVALAALVPFFVLYLMGSFIAVSFDIAKWEGVGRFLVASGGCFFGAMAAQIAWEAVNG